MGRDRRERERERGDMEREGREGESERVREGKGHVPPNEMPNPVDVSESDPKNPLYQI